MASSHFPSWILNHLLLKDDTFIVILLHQLREKSLFIFAIHRTIGTNRIVLIQLKCEIFVQDFINSCGRMSFLKEGLWRDIVLHNKVRVQTIEVKTNHPIILSRNRFLDVCSCVFFIFLRPFLRRDNNIFLPKIVIDDAVPKTNLEEDILIVHLGIISPS